ncbi:WD40 repeat-like protein [Violaceomyces palustris]|uniref:WD40 repeat-like protein n=1 Tax=Violaceomyces palustris TaxID=1673888 RepID=A0ACD0NT41_9BASI|nr:WD40 repeat-like protein [Violaceomyces palustris]
MPSTDSKPSKDKDKDKDNETDKDKAIEHNKDKEKDQEREKDKETNNPGATFLSKDASTPASLKEPISTPIATNTNASLNSGSVNGASTLSTADQNASVLAYLQKRGFGRAEAAFRAEIDALAAGATPDQAVSAAAAHVGSHSVSLVDLAAKSTPRESKEKEKEKEKSGEASVSTAVDAESDSSTAAVQALLLDPTDRARGFSMLRSWCEGSLDIYQPELLPLLLPLFINSFLDLVSIGYGGAASAFYSAHATSFLPTHTALLSQIRSLALPSHIESDPLAQRFRTERYVLKMSNTVFSLLLGWLTDGTGPVVGVTDGEGLGFDGPEAPARRGREAMLKIVNERCRIQVLAAHPYQIDSAILEEGTGLTGAGPSYSSNPTGSTGRSRQYPALAKQAVSQTDAVADFNAKAAGPQLKLHPTIPLSERLQAEVEKEINDADRREKEQEAALLKAETAAAVGTSGGEEAPATAATAAQKGEENDVTMADGTNGEQNKAPQPQQQPTEARESSPVVKATARQSEAPNTTTSIMDELRPTFSSDLLAPSLTDLPPQPPTFRTVDIRREIQKVRDARKRIRLDPSLVNLPAASTGLVGSVPGFLTGVRDPTVNAMGEQGARAARVAALPSVCAYTYHDADDGVTCSTFSQDTTLMAAGFEESFIQVWSLKGEKLRGLKGDVNLSAVRDSKSLRKQRETEGQTTKRLIGHSGAVYGIDFDPTGGGASAPRHLLSSSADGSARLWSLDTFSALVAYRGHQHPVWDIKWSPIGTYFATASADKTARLWSTERINPLRMYAGHLSDVDCLSFHPNSLYLATGSSDRSCRLWDVQRGACVRLLVGHQSPISCLKVSPDGRYLASAASGQGLIETSANDVSISLWDLASGRRIKRMWGHTSRVHDLDFSADGSLLVSAGSDCTVRCWDVRSAGGARRSPNPGSLEAQQIAAAKMTNGSSSKNPAVAEGLSAAAAATVAAAGNVVVDPITSSASSQAGWKDEASSVDCVATFHTKRTPVIDVHFTPRNLCLVAGVYDDSL